MKIRRLSDALGAEVTGVDLAKLSNSLFTEINAAFLKHQVLCFRRQTLTAIKLIKFSECFGEVLPHDNLKFTLKSHPKILVLSNDVDKDGNQLGVIDAGDTWHSDHQFKKRTAKCTILYSLKNPSTGGATDFTNQYAAYETLPAGTKEKIKFLRGHHSISKLKNKRAMISGEREDAIEFYKRQELEIPDVEHPLVRIHSETSRKSLFCSPRFTIGLKGINEQEGEQLLDQLIAHSIKPKFRYRHFWEEGDVVMWDNRCTNHRATGGYSYPDIRHLYRTTVEGDAP